MVNSVVTQEMIDGAELVYESAKKTLGELEAKFSRQKAAEHAAKSRAALPQMCNDVLCEHHGVRGVGSGLEEGRLPDAGSRH